VNPSRLTLLSRDLLLGVSVVVFCSSCGTDTPRDSKRPLPDAALGRRAVESSLGKWQDSPDHGTTSPSTSPSVVFVDQQRRPGQRLRAYAVLGESESETGRRFVVKLSLAEPDESILAAYYVFGQDPIWVYRSEDFDMIMHWEHPMPADPPVAADPPKPEDTRKTKSEHHDHAPQTAATGEKTG
jgi:hypothetical protein